MPSRSSLENIEIPERKSTLRCVNIFYGFSGDLRSNFSPIFTMLLSFEVTWGRMLLKFRARIVHFASYRGTAYSNPHHKAKFWMVHSESPHTHTRTWPSLSIPFLHLRQGRVLPFLRIEDEVRGRCPHRGPRRGWTGLAGLAEWLRKRKITLGSSHRNISEAAYVQTNRGKALKLEKWEEKNNEDPLYQTSQKSADASDNYEIK